MTHTVKNAFLTVTVSEKGAELQSIQAPHCTHTNTWTITAQ